MSQGDALVRHWLHAEPSDDLEEWHEQIRQALWLEKRMFTGLARTIHGDKAVKK